MLPVVFGILLVIIVIVVVIVLRRRRPDFLWRSRRQYEHVKLGQEGVAQEYSNDMFLMDNDDDDDDAFASRTPIVKLKVNSLQIILNENITSF